MFYKQMFSYLFLGKTTRGLQLGDLLAGEILELPKTGGCAKSAVLDFLAVSAGLAHYFRTFLVLAFAVRNLR